MKTIPKKRGRPRIHENPVWFGMKISLKQREMIKKLAKERGTSASQAIMEMVENSLAPKTPQKALSATEMMKLPPAERKKLLQAQAKEAAYHYLHDKDLFVEDNSDILEY